MRNLSMLFVIVLLLFPAEVFGQQDPKFQLRIPTHIQVAEDAVDSPTSRLGVAVWAILPNTFAPNNNLATLLVGGLLWKDRDGNWLELMGGARLNQDGYVDPIFNLRFLNTQIPKVLFSGEIQQSFREDKRRFLWWGAVDTPIYIWKLRAGVETENVNFWKRKDSYGIGPRITFPVPIKLPKAMKLGAVATYQIRNDRNFLRIYVISNFQVHSEGRSK